MVEFETNHIQQVAQDSTLALFFFIPFLFLIAVLFAYVVHKVVKRRVDNPKQPCEQAEGRTIVPPQRMSSAKTRLSAIVIIIVVAISGIVMVGQMPVHRTNIEHTDPSGDVTDADIDIVQIRSYSSGAELYLEITVAGSIVETNATTIYRYNIIVVAKGLADDSSAHIYTLTYENGSMVVSSYTSHSYVNGATLTIMIPISTFTQGNYMIGLEGWTQTTFEQDYTSEDRDGEVAHLLF